MSGSGYQRSLGAEDVLPEPGPSHADESFKDDYGLVYRCLYTEGLGWEWRTGKV